MKKLIKTLSIILITTVLLCSKVSAHGGNITGWRDRNSDQIVEHDGIYYGYHNENGVRHYHQVKWNEQEQRWEILKTAVYYDENFNIIDNTKNTETKKIEVKYSASVDGDTAKFELNGAIITVRFLGIDTPETVHPTKGEEPYGKDASNFTKEKLQNAKKIEIEYDENASKTDKYERHLAWIWVDDILLEDELIKNGLAKTYMLQDNYKYAGRLQESEEIAKKEKKGIWSNEETTTQENTEAEEINKSRSITEENTQQEVMKDINVDIRNIIIGAVTLSALITMKSMLKRTKKKKRKARK